MILSIRLNTCRPLLLAAPALALVATAGCGTGTSATGEWAAARPANLPYHKILVIGDAPNSRVRRSFEEQMVEDLSTGGTLAAASILIGSEMNNEKLDPETVATMVQTTNADAVLVTRLVSRTTKAGETEEKVDIKAQPMISITEEPGLTMVFASNYTMEIDPGQELVKSRARLESVVYDVRDGGRPVYKMAVQSKFTEETGDELVDITGNIADAISKDLHEARLVR